jgi:cytochrome c-type biogenesis protein CcmH/NrfG
MAFGALAAAGGPFAQRLWDDPAFVLYQEAAGALDAGHPTRAAALAARALAHYPDFVLAHFLAGQAALARGRWEEAVAAFQAVLRLYPGSMAGRRALQAAMERATQPGPTEAREGQAR